MSQEVDTIKFVKIALVALAFLFSFVGAILVFATDFGEMYIGAPSYYAGYCLGCSYLAGWYKIFLVLLALGFLACSGIAVILGLTSLGIFTLKFSRPLGFLGVLGAVFTFVFTGINVGIFAILAAGWEWWLEAGFYGGLIGSILTGIFFILYIVLGTTGKPSEAPSK